MASPPQTYPSPRARQRSLAKHPQSKPIPLQLAAWSSHENDCGSSVSTVSTPTASLRPRPSIKHVACTPPVPLKTRSSSAQRFWIKAGEHGDGRDDQTQQSLVAPQSAVVISGSKSGSVGTPKVITSQQRIAMDKAFAAFDKIDITRDGRISKIEVLDAVYRNPRVLSELHPVRDGEKPIDHYITCNDYSSVKLAVDKLFKVVANDKSYLDKEDLRKCFIGSSSDRWENEDPFDRLRIICSGDDIDNRVEIEQNEPRDGRGTVHEHVCRLQSDSPHVWKATPFPVSLPRIDSMVDSDACIFGQIDTQRIGSFSKFDMHRSVQHYPGILKKLLQGFQGQGVWTEEEIFNAIEIVFDNMSLGNKRVDLKAFMNYFQKLRLPKPKLPNYIDRNQKRVLIIGTGFGREVNPQQGAMIEDAGFQVHWVLNLPNPEQPGFQIHPHVIRIRQEIESFQPDVVASASKGNLYVMGLWQFGYWQGPTLMINASHGVQNLPKGVPVVIAHGSNDELYRRSRTDLEQLVSSGSPNKCFLYYSSNCGHSTGGIARLGDMHNMESLLSYDCLPRLIDAALSPVGPEVQMVWSWRGRLSENRLRAEQQLGYDPEALRQHWTSSSTQYLHEVHRDSEEFRCICEIYFGEPNEPSAYTTNSRLWEHSGIIKVERVENAFQIDGAAMPYLRTLRKSFESQDVALQPGAHTRWLFHGTDAIESIVSNPMHGFQPLSCGTRLGSVWGSGTYFARDAKYVVNSNFCSARPDGSHRLLMCLVTIGIPCLGDPSHVGVLPMRQPPHRYNCTVDSLSNPEVFIVQHPSAAYPAYVITFASSQIR